MPSPELERLTDGLKPDNLHLIALGPGYGESLCIRAPGAGWLVVDSFNLDKDENPALEAVRRQEVSGLILTHPHDDHAPGFDQLAHTFPESWIGCAPSWLKEGTDVDLTDAEAVQRNGATCHALAAVDYHWRKRPDLCWKLHRGNEKVLGEAKLTVLHPGDSHLQEFQRRPKVNPNNLSSPILLTWGNCRLVLGADLPEFYWREVDHTLELGRHALLKIPHHGSANAIHACYADGSQDRYWLAAPWNLPPGLPRFEQDQGIARLLNFVSSIRLTALPYKLEKLPHVVSRKAVEEAVQAASVAASMRVPGIKVKALLASNVSPCQGWIRVSLDKTGNIVDEQFGQLAHRITAP